MSASENMYFSTPKQCSVPAYRKPKQNHARKITSNKASKFKSRHAQTRLEFHNIFKDRNTKSLYKQNQTGKGSRITILNAAQRISNLFLSLFNEISNCQTLVKANTTGMNALTKKTKRFYLFISACVWLLLQTIFVTYLAYFVHYIQRVKGYLICINFAFQQKWRNSPRHQVKFENFFWMILQKD